MITEFLLAGALQFGYVKINKMIRESKYRDDIRAFKDLCLKHKLPYKIIETCHEEYGTKLIVSLKGDTFSTLEKHNDELQINTSSKVEIIQNENIKTATIYILKNKLNDIDNKFEPMVVKPSEVYIGLDNKFNPMIIDLNDYPHLICSGSTGVGKSEELKIIVANSIKFNKDNLLNIHICNVGHTGDFDDFIDCKQVKSFSQEYDEIQKQFEYILHTYDNRIETFRRYGVKNIKQFNNKFKNSPKKMPTIFLLIDEIASLYPNGEFDKNVAIKSELFNSLCDMGRRVRKAGIFLLVGIQRPSRQVFNPELKQNLNIKIGFNQNNTASSLVAMDNEKVAKIGRRNFLVEYGCEEHWARSLYIDDDMVKDIIKDSVVKNRQNLDDFNSFLKNNKTEKTKSTKAKNKPIASKKTKIINISDEVASGKVSKVKNVETLDNINYEVDNGKICIRMKERIKEA